MRGKALLGSLITSAGDGGPAMQAQLFGPAGLAVASAENIYVADKSNYRVRKIDTSGIISTIAGNGIAASSGDGGPATEASLNLPGAVAVDKKGSIFITETGANKIRQITPDGTISTFAGTGSQGSTGNVGPAIDATFEALPAMITDQSGNVFVIDETAPGVLWTTVRRISPDGIITRVLGGGTAPSLGEGAFAASLQILVLAVLTPMPRASDKTTVAVETGVLRIWRNAYRICRLRRSSHIHRFVS
jgi:hypothetical protein